MSQPIIEVRGLSKCYRLGAIGTTSLREEFHRAWDRFRGRAHPDSHDFWALRDVSFDINAGEVVGIIGRNGAGKSTLLKILSRITEPTSGSARLRGRVASLLEVGTGFHPELTGRENVFLNGAILGMTRAEVRAKFDEIVAFAEVDKFIDTPVKRYSSGMYVRLAFAVAAHLEPEILIVDEVLAVGDAQFQRKCLGKMESVAQRDGRSIIFVSHNIDAIFRLCSSCLWLDAGRVASLGRTAQVATAYLAAGAETQSLRPIADRSRDARLRLRAKFTAVQPPGMSGPASILPFGQPVRFVCVVAVAQPVRDLSLAVAVFSSGGVEIASARLAVAPQVDTPPGQYEIVVTLPEIRLNVQRFTCNVGLASDGGEEDFVDNAATFDVSSSTLSAEQHADTIPAPIVPRAEFTLRRLP